MFSSMKKGIKSLRLPRKPIRADEVNSQRRRSEGNVGMSRSEDYPGTCTWFNMFCVR